MIRTVSCVKYAIVTFVAVVLFLGISTTSESKSKYNYPISGGSPPPLSYPTEPSNVGNQGSDVVTLSDGMFRDLLPRLSNMDYGFLYEFSSKGTNRSFFFSDTFLPLVATCRDVFFCQTHYGYNSFYNGGTYENGSAAYRVDAAVGGGYRFFLNDPSIMVLGFNGFWDTSQLYGSWWNSWGVGLEMAIGMPANGLFDFTANNYGNQFQNMQNVADLWRKGNVNFDLEAGYSQGTSDGSIDVRCKYNAYQFSLGDNQTINGNKGGVDLSTGDGLVKIGWEIGHDRDKGTYNTIGASINLGFQVECLLYGQNPITMPQSIFMSPERNPRKLLAKKVTRNTNLPDKVVTANRNTPTPTPTSPSFTLSITTYVVGNGSLNRNSDTSMTWNVTTAVVGTDNVTTAQSYSVGLADASGLTFPLTATITPNATQPTGHFTVNPSGVADVPQTITFNNAAEIVTIGTALNPVPSVTRQVGAGTTGNQGTMSISAPGVTTLTVNVNEPSTVAPHFELAINGPYLNGSSGTYVKNSDSSGTWTVTYAADPGPGYVCTATSYTITLVGDTTALTFPLTVTITPNQVPFPPAGYPPPPPDYLSLRLRAQDGAGQNDVSETVTMNNSADLVKTIGPGGQGDHPGTRNIPDIYWTGSLPTTTGGNFTISATGVPSLVVGLVSTN